jgi:hypothetical protein
MHKLLASLMKQAIGNWRTDTFEMELKNNHQILFMPNYPYLFPQLQEQELKDKVQKLVQSGVFCKVNRSKWP